MKVICSVCFRPLGTHTIASSSGPNDNKLLASLNQSNPCINPSSNSSFQSNSEFICSPSLSPNLTHPGSLTNMPGNTLPCTSMNSFPNFNEIDNTSSLFNSVYSMYGNSNTVVSDTLSSTSAFNNYQESCSSQSLDFPIVPSLLSSGSDDFFSILNSALPMDSYNSDPLKENGPGVLVEASSETNFTSDSHLSTPPSASTSRRTSVHTNDHDTRSESPGDDTHDSADSGIKSMGSSGDEGLKELFTRFIPDYDQNSNLKNSFKDEFSANSNDSNMNRNQCNDLMNGFQFGTTVDKCNVNSYDLGLNSSNFPMENQLSTSMFQQDSKNNDIEDFLEGLMATPSSGINEGFRDLDPGFNEPLDTTDNILYPNDDVLYPNNIHDDESKQSNVAISYGINEKLKDFDQSFSQSIDCNNGNNVDTNHVHDSKEASNDTNHVDDSKKGSNDIDNEVMLKSGNDYLTNVAVSSSSGTIPKESVVKNSASSKKKIESNPLLNSNMVASRKCRSKRKKNPFAADESADKSSVFIRNVNISSFSGHSKRSAYKKYSNDSYQPKFGENRVCSASGSYSNNSYSNNSVQNKLENNHAHSDISSYSNNSNNNKFGENPVPSSNSFYSNNSNINCEENRVPTVNTLNNINSKTEENPVPAPKPTVSVKPRLPICPRQSFDIKKKVETAMQKKKIAMEKRDVELRFYSRIKKNNQRSSGKNVKLPEKIVDTQSDSDIEIIEEIPKTNKVDIAPSNPVSVPSAQKISISSINPVNVNKSIGLGKPGIMTLSLKSTLGKKFESMLSKNVVKVNNISNNVNLKDKLEKTDSMLVQIKNKENIFPKASEVAKTTLDSTNDSATNVESSNLATSHPDNAHTVSIKTESNNSQNAKNEGANQPKNPLVWENNRFVLKVLKSNAPVKDEYDGKPKLKAVVQRKNVLGDDAPIEDDKKDPINEDNLFDDDDSAAIEGQDTKPPKDLLSKLVDELNFDCGELNDFI